MRTAFIIFIAFFLAACGTEVPMVTVTLTPTTTPEATATATIEPTPTLAPKPDYINNDNSVETDDGTVFVKDGKYMLYDPKTGEIREIKDISTEVTFNTTADASKVVLAMHADEFAHQNVEDWLPGNLSKVSGYSNAIKEIQFGGHGGFGYIPVFGRKVEAVIVKSPTGSLEFPENGVIFLNIYGDKTPFPFTVALFNAQENFYPLHRYKAVNKASNYAAGETETRLSDGFSWKDYQRVTNDNLVLCMTLVSAPPGMGADYAEDWTEPELPPAVKAERLKLLAIQALQAEDGYNYLVEAGGDATTAGVVSAIVAQSDMGGVFVSKFDRLPLIDPTQ